MPGGVVTNQVGTRLYWRHNLTPFDRNRGNGSARNKWGQLSTVPICSVVSEKKSKDARMSSFFSLEFNSTISRNFWHRHWKKKVCIKKNKTLRFLFHKVNAQGQLMTYELRIGWVLLWTGWVQVLLNKVLRWSLFMNQNLGFGLVWKISSSWNSCTF